MKPFKKFAMEGLIEGNGGVLNCLNIRVQIFKPEVREYYQHESLCNPLIKEESKKPIYCNKMLEL